MMGYPLFNNRSVSAGAGDINIFTGIQFIQGVVSKASSLENAILS
jgi:hypothetical protein